MNKEEKKEKKKLTLKEKLSDKREKAKIELIAYCVFFAIVVIFSKLMGGNTPSQENGENNINDETVGFLAKIDDNYEYDIIITINNENYHYYGKVLGNNKSINLLVDDEINSYIFMNNKYYSLENDNYILTTQDEVYPYINNRYLNTTFIKQYLQIAEKENDTYKIKVNDLILNSNSLEYITININEGDKNIVIDYTPLFKLNDENIQNVLVNITYSNIGNLISLENN